MIDAGWDKVAASEAIKAYAHDVSEKPIVALFYSHGHADHVGGAQAFVDSAGADLAIYAEKSSKEYQLERVGPSATHFTVRAAAQMGLLLPAGPAGRMPTGGGKLRASAVGFRYVPPTHDIDGETTLEIAGVRIAVLRSAEPQSFDHIDTKYYLSELLGFPWEDPPASDFDADAARELFDMGVYGPRTIPEETAEYFAGVYGKGAAIPVAEWR